MQETTLPIARLAKQNSHFRRVVMTGGKAQVVLMSIPEGQDIGAETHEGHDQILFFVEGSGIAEVDGVKTEVGPGDMSFVPSGAYHNFINNGEGPLKLFTTYSPPEHEAGTEHATRKEAHAAEA
ncbi:MAG: cupin domain-containing protein [Alphaproteobacteria bacterium]|nr:cupin domain-containing protein [Alphaproteobacteria bacterium]